MGKPWEAAPDLWPTEKAYCQWLRSRARKVWACHPIKHRLVAANRVPVEDVPVDLRPAKLNSRTKSLCQCSMCDTYTTPSNIEVDHKEMAGSFSSVAEWHEWLDRLLLVGQDDLRILCKPCHKKVNLSQRFGCDIKEAELRQKLAAFKKLRVQQMRAVLEEVDAISAAVGFSKKQCEGVYVQWLRDNPDGPA